jgi:glycosyltransferase involved in cell wall biosynthesis
MGWRWPVPTEELRRVGGTDLFDDRQSSISRWERNPESKDWIPKRYWDKALVFLKALVPRNSTPRGHVMVVGRRLFAGRLLPWKGVFLALKALELLPKWQLIICGTGAPTKHASAFSRSAGDSCI